jgi:AcrR family transcriptional regulator
MRAIADTVAADGVAGSSVSGVMARARMSRNTFYALFPNLDAGMLTLLDETLSRGLAEMAAAYAGDAPWPRRVHDSIRILLELIDGDPALARVCLVESLAGGPELLAARARALELIARALEQGGPGVRRGVGAKAPLAAEAVVGAIASILHARLSRRPAQCVGELASELTAIATMPYLESGAAPPEPGGGPARAVARRERRQRAENVLEGLDMRITYRTMLVLSAIEQAPGSSNCEVARAGGIADQGQISRLLARLRELGLVHNEGGGQRAGASNAWRLTARGRQVQAALSARSRL